MSNAGYAARPPTGGEPRVAPPQPRDLPALADRDVDRPTDALREPDDPQRLPAIEVGDVPRGRTEPDSRPAQQHVHLSLGAGGTAFRA